MPLNPAAQIETSQGKYFATKHVVANELMLTEKLAPTMILANDSNEWQNQVNNLSCQPFTATSLANPKNTLKDFIDETAVLKLIKRLI
jgi:hypothetical protein